jgi:hypothetical protein
MSKIEEEHVTGFKDFQSPHEASVERLISAVDKAYHHPWSLIWRSFWYGFFAAIGAVVGTVCVAIFSVFLFRALGGFELLKPAVSQIEEATNQVIESRLQQLEHAATPTGKAHQ